MIHYFVPPSVFLLNSITSFFFFLSLCSVKMLRKFTYTWTGLASAVVTATVRCLVFFFGAPPHTHTHFIPDVYFSKVLCSDLIFLLSPLSLCVLFLSEASFLDLFCLFFFLCNTALWEYVLLSIDCWKKARAYQMEGRKSTWVERISLNKLCCRHKSLTPHEDVVYFLCVCV